MIIALSGYIGCGKDTVGGIIQDLTSPISDGYGYLKGDKWVGAHGPSTWQIRKFASKLKQIASILTGISVEKFENQEFKKTYLSKEWGKTLIDGDGLGGTIPLSVREFLQKLGTEAIRNNIHTNAWVNALFVDYKQELDHHDLKNPEFTKYPDWVITDCRFPNEANAIKDRGGIVVRIDRYVPLEMYHTKPGGGMTVDIDKSIMRHPSETSLDSWVFDYTINNNGTIEELTGKVKKMLEEFNI